MKKRGNNTNHKSHLLIYAALIAFAFVLYGNTIPNKYSLDDVYVTKGNPQVKKGLQGIPEIFTSRYANVNNDDGSQMRFGYRPVSKSTFAIEHHFFGQAPHVSHFINVLLYALLLIVLYRLLRKLMTQLHPVYPLLVVLLFAAHPAHTEAVASLKNRDEILVALFAFLAIGRFVKYYDKKTITSLIAGITLFLLAYLSKASALMYLAVFPLVLVFFRDVNYKKIALIVLSALVVALVVRYAPRLFLPTPSRPILFVENPLLFEDNKWLHVSTGFSVLLFYLKQLLWPSTLLFYYGYDMIPVVNFANIEVIASILIHLGLLVLAVYYFRKKPVISFAVLFYFISISMYANMVKPVMGIVADRYLFIPVLSLSLVLAYLIMKAVKAPIGKPKAELPGKILITVLMLIILIPYSVKTISRNTDWETQLTLTESDIGDLENSAKANYLYGLSLKNHLVGNQSWKTPEGKEQAELMIKHFRRAIEIYPDYYDAWNQLGEIYMVVNRNYDMARKLFRKAIDINPDLRKGYYNLGYVNYINKEYDEARKYFHKFLEFNPEHVQVHSFMSKMAFRENNLEKALEWNKKILDFEPESAEAYFNMGNFLLQHGDTTQAVDYFERSAEINPNNTQLNKNLYRHFKREGNEEKANYYLNLNNK
ncbi:MAG: tetratricopeptide repeat protein [Bacteroidota bacterium]